MRLKRLCACGREAVGRCECKESKTRTIENPKGYRYPNGWAEFARLYRSENPLCHACLDEGRTTPTKEVHHIAKVKDRPDLVFDKDNLMAVCRSCHERLERQG
jgi:5-methylcytosine-specific restriction enzyme A